MNVFELFAKLSLDSSEYEKGLDDGEKKAGTFGQNLKSAMSGAAKIGAAAVGTVTTAVVATGTAMVSQTNAVAAYGDNIDKMSQKLGLSAEAYQQWDYVLGQAGTDIDSMSTGMKTLTNKLDDAKNGSESAQQMFAKLGISMDDINSMSREDLFEATITGFQGMADSTERAALANDLFGKSGQELTPLFNSSIDDTKELLQASKDLGFVMSNDSVKAAADYQDALDTMTRTMGGIKTTVVSSFLPSMTMVMDGLTQIFAGNGGGQSILTEGISSAITAIQEAIPRIKEVGGAILSSLYNAILENLPQIAQGGTELIVSLVTGLIEALPDLVTASITLVTTIVQTLWENLPQIYEAGKSAIESLVSGMDPVEMINKGGELLDSFISKALDYLPKLMETGVNFIGKMADGVSKNLPTILSAITTVLQRLITTIMQRLPDFLQKGMELIQRMSQGLLNNLPTIISSMIQMLAQLAATIAQNLPAFLQKGIELIGQMAQGFIQAIPQIVGSIPQIIQSIWNAFTSYNWGGIGWNLIQGIANGVFNAGRNLVNAAIQVVADAWNAMKRWLGIASPSKKAEKELGRFWAEGIGVGFEKNMPTDDMVGAIDDTFEKLAGDMPDVTANYNNNITNAGSGWGSAPVINIYPRENQDEKKIADEVDRILTFRARQQKRAFA